VTGDRKSTSQLKNKPLRQAGQSADEERNRIIDEGIMPLVIISLVVVFFAVLEWYRSLVDVPPRPVLATVLAVGVIAYSFFKGARLTREARSWRLGRDGERRVGQLLDTLHTPTCFVLHDIVGDRFNVDHVVVSEKGIFVIETKAYSKPGGDKRVRFDGSRLTIDGLGDKTNAIDQARANANWIANRLKASTGKDYPVRPVVLFPDWFCEPMPKGCAVWALEPKGFLGFFEREKAKIPPEEVHWARERLEAYIRGAAD